MALGSRLRLSLVLLLSTQALVCIGGAGCDRAKRREPLKSEPTTLSPMATGGAATDASGRTMLTVFVVSTGISIKGPGGNVATGCNEVGPGLAVPAVDGGQQDFTELRRCAVKLKATVPELATQRSITIVADHAITYATVIATMDAVRSTADGSDLFPDVIFGPPPKP